MVLIYQDWVSYSEFVSAPNDIGRDALALGLRGVNSNYDDIFIGKLFLPIRIGRQIGKTVAAGKRPEFNDRHLPAAVSEVDYATTAGVYPGSADQLGCGNAYRFRFPRGP